MSWPARHPEHRIGVHPEAMIDDVLCRTYLTHYGHESRCPATNCSIIAHAGIATAYAVWHHLSTLIIHTACYIISTCHILIILLVLSLCCCASTAAYPMSDKSQIGRHQCVVTYKFDTALILYTVYCMLFTASWLASAKTYSSCTG